MDLGTIRYSVEAETSDLTVASEAMNKMAESATKAGVAVDGMSAKTAKSAAPIAAQAKQLNALGTSYRNTRGIAQQFGWQIQDVAVQLQMGTNGMLVFTQQGSQLLSAFNPLAGAVLAVGGALVGAMLPSLFSTGKATEDLAENVRSLNSDLQSMPQAWRDAVNAASGLVESDIVAEFNKQTEAIKKQKEAIAELNSENGKSRIDLFTESETGSWFVAAAAGFDDLSIKAARVGAEFYTGLSDDSKGWFAAAAGGFDDLAIKAGMAAKAYAEGSVDNSKDIIEEQKNLAAIEVARIKTLKELAAVQDPSGSNDKIKALAEEYNLLGLTGRAYWDLKADQEGLLGINRQLYIDINMRMEQKKKELELDKKAANKKPQIDQIAKLISQMEREVALYGEKSKAAQMEYDIRKEIIKVSGGLESTQGKRLMELATTMDLNTAETERVKGIEAITSKLKEEANQAGITQREYIKMQLAALGASDAVMANAMADFDKAGLYSDIDSITKSIDGFGDQWSRTGSVIVDAFGGIVGAMDDYLAKMEAIDKTQSDIGSAKDKAKGDKKALAELNKLEIANAKRRTKANLSSYRMMAGAASEMFDEQSKGRKALHNAEMVFAAAEIAISLQKAGANALAAITSAFAAPFPVNFAAGAAMIGIMAGLGVFGGGGGGGGPSAADIQENQGTGTVLGSDDKSESITNALESYSDIGIDQLSELRGIRDAMIGLSSGIAQLAVGFVASGQFKGSGVSGLGKTQNVSIGGGLEKILDDLAPMAGTLINKALGGIFGSKKTELKDTGLKFGAQELGDILSGQLELDYYNTIKTTKKKLYGLSKKTSTKDQLTEADDSSVNEITKIFSFIASGVSESISLLGIVSEKSLNDFAISIGKISFKDLSGDEIQAELEAVFSQQADLLAAFMLPQIEEYQRMGEGAFDTLTRVAREQAIFNDAIDVMGLSLGELSAIMRVDVAQSVIDLVGGFEKFTKLSSTYVDKFFTDAEKFNILTGSINDMFGDLGLTAPKTREEFRSLVEAQDLTTESGRELFASLMSISGAVSDYTESLIEQEKVLVDSAFSALERAVSAEKKIISAQVSVLNQSLNASKSVFGALESSLKGLVINSNQTLAANRRGAQSQLSGFIDSARGGSLPNIDDLNSALSVISQPSEQLYSTFSEYAMDFARTAASIKELKDITGAQITDEEKTIAELTAHSEYLDQMVSYAKDQIDIMRGIDISILSVAQAMTNLGAYIQMPIPQLPPEQLNIIRQDNSEAQVAAAKQQAEVQAQNARTTAIQEATLENNIKIRKILEDFQKYGSPLDDATIAAIGESVAEALP